MRKLKQQKKEQFFKQRLKRLGHFMTNRHKKNFFLTTTSPILIKIGVCGYLIAKTRLCKYYVSTTNTF